MKPINLFKPEQSDFKQMLSVGGKQVYLNSNKILALVTNADTYQFDEKRLSTDRMFSRGDIAYYDDDYYMITTQVAHRYESFNGQMRRLENHIYFNMSFLPNSPNKYIMKIPVIPQKTGEFNLRTNNTWGIVDVVQRISLFVPENEWTARISELENKPDGIIIFGRRPYQIIGVTNNDKGMYAINLELTTLDNTKYDKENGIYMPPSNWKNYENLSIYDLSAEQINTIPQVQTNVGVIKTQVLDEGWSIDLQVNWEKDKSSPLYAEYLTGYKVGVYYNGILDLEKVISDPDTTEVTLSGFKDTESYTVKIEAIYAKEGTVTYMLPQIYNVGTKAEPFPQQQTNVGTITLSNNNDSLDILWEKDKTLPDNEKYLSKYLVNIYSNDESTPKLITQIDNGLNLHLQWKNNTGNIPKSYKVGIQSVFVIDGQETIMTEQLASIVVPPTITHTAYAYSADGTDRFSTVYPNLNLLDGTKDFSGNWEYKSSVVDDGFYNNLVVKSQSNSGTGILKRYIVRKDGDYTFSAWVSASAGQLPSFTIGKNRIAQGGVTLSNTAFDWIRVTYTLKNVKSGDELTGRIDKTSNVSGKVSVAGHKWEFGSTATPYMTSTSEVTTSDYPSYIGTYSDDKISDSTNPSDYTWSFSQKQGTVTVTYKATDGTKLKDDVVIQQVVGTPYRTIIDSFTGYTFKTVIGNITGLITLEPQTVKYTYEKDVVQGTVTVNYVDDKDVAIKPIVTLTGDVGSQYQTEQSEITGYNFLSVDGQTSGLFTKEPITVTYKYKKDVPVQGTVTVYYKDMNGKDISTPVTMTGNVGDEYTTEKKTISDYSFSSDSGNTKGVYKTEPIEVKYIYDEDSGW